MASGCSCALKLSTHPLPCEKIYPCVCRGRFTLCTRQPTPPPARPDGPAGRFSRRAALVGAAAAAATVTMPAACAQAASRRLGTVRDLTHVFRAGFPVYADDPPGRRTVATIEDTGFYVQAWSFAEHMGAHLDAPGHVVPGGRLVPELGRRCSPPSR